MQSEAKTVDQYFDELPEDRKEVMHRLRKLIKENLPDGFEEAMGYGMPGYVVPFSRYPQGYRCDPSVPLPFAGLASQKNHIAVYHMGMYAKPGLHEWFEEEYAKRVGKKPDLGKSCLRFRPTQDIPYDLLAELFRKITVDEWISMVDKI